jgi:tetratricopeptide (TPR) repeat protein
MKEQNKQATDPRMLTSASAHTGQTMYKLIVFLGLTLALVAGCDTKTEEAAVAKQNNITKPPVTTPLLSEPLEASLVETATGALPVWRTEKEHQPALVILSNNPFLQAIPKPLQEEAQRLVISASKEDIEAKAVYQSANPTLMPAMAVSAALRTNLFSQVVWVLPVVSDTPMPAPQVVSAQLLAASDISADEADTFTAEGEILTAQIRNTPWTICRLESLPEINEPVVLHIDLSYLSALYKNEITTPLYSIITNVGQKLRDSDWKALGATVSLSNLSGDIALKTRFLGQDIVSMLASPELLDAETIPELWRQRGNVFYLESLFQTEKILDIYLELEQRFPQSASIKYGLFDIYGQLNDPEKALQYLSEAVALDPIYALEYLNLSERAFSKGQIQASMDMLNKAAETFPDNPFITFKKVGLYKQTGGMALAAPLIEELQQLDWSEAYDPNMPQWLDSLAEEAEAARTNPPSAD